MVEGIDKRCVILGCPSGGESDAFQWSAGNSNLKEVQKVPICLSEVTAFDRTRSEESPRPQILWTQPKLEDVLQGWLLFCFLSFFFLWTKILVTTLLLSSPELQICQVLLLKPPSYEDTLHCHEQRHRRSGIVFCLIRC